METKGKTGRIFVFFSVVFFSVLFIFSVCLAMAVSPPADVALGLAPDEQQGGAGLVGDMVRTINGNNVLLRQDLNFSSPNRLGLLFNVTYNSQSSSSGLLGHGWTHTYGSFLDPSFEVEGQIFLKITDSTGRAAYFLEETPGVFRGAFNELSYVRTKQDGYIRYCLDGRRLCFNSSGVLIRLEDEKGNRLVVSHDSQGRPDTVTDMASGRMLIFEYDINGLLKQIKGPVTEAVPSGVWVTYGFDANLNLASVNYADGSGFDYIYSDPEDMHNITESRDKQGHIIVTFSYDNLDRVLHNFSVDGKGATLNYAGETQVDVTDAFGSLRTYTIEEIEGRKRVVSVAGPPNPPYSFNNIIRWDYDSIMRLVETEDAADTVNQYQDYDDRGNPKTIKLAFNSTEERTITFTYHPAMNVPLSRTEPSLLGSGNKVTIWDYDADYDDSPNEAPTGNLSRLIEKGFTKDASGNLVAYEYITTITHNSRGQILSVDGPLPGGGDTVFFAYDPAKEDLLSITRPLIGSMYWADYDDAGRPERITDVNGFSRVFSYDAGGRITGITNNADAGVSTTVYNTAGQQESVIDEDGVTSAYLYDSSYGRLIKTTDSKGNYISYDYNDQGNLIEKGYHEPSGSRTGRKRWSYQHPVIPGMLWKKINPDETFTEYDYDDAGNISSITDPNLNTTQYFYDALARLVRVMQPGNATTYYSYNSQDKLTSVIDAERNETTYIYDDMGRLISTTSPDTGTTTYEYNQTGNLVGKTDARGIEATYAYDLINRLNHIGFPDQSQDIVYTYDIGTYGKGRLSGISDPSGNATFMYDLKGRLIEKGSAVSGITFSMLYTYSPGGRPLTLTYPSGRAVHYTRENCACSIDGVSTTFNGETTTLLSDITYRPFGGAAGMETGGGGVSNIFDESSRLTVLNPGSEKERTFTYDANGNLASIHAANDSRYNRDFSYDHLNRLKQATGPYGTVDLTYDKVGNRLSKGVDALTDSYRYISGSNQLHRIFGYQPDTFSYDANGNIVGTETMIYEYNQANRLAGAYENGIRVGEYVYNGRGERVKKVADGRTTFFIYNKDGNLICEANDSGNITLEYIYLGKSLLCQFVHETRQEIEVTVTVDNGTALPGIHVYAFTESGAYTGIHGLTDDQGVARFATTDFADNNYKFRADYLTYHFWSPVIEVPGDFEAGVVVEDETAEVTVIVAGEAKEGVTVYLFNETDSYLGIYAITDSEGKISFDLPVNQSFKFRADHMTGQYWSETTLIGSETSVEIDAEGGIFSVTVQKEDTQPLSDINVYLFNSSDAYLGYYGSTDENGTVAFSVSGGDYKVRADYMGYQFWSQEVTVGTDEDLILTINHQDVQITVSGDYNGDLEPKENVNVYLFSPTDSYIGLYHVTNEQGQVIFNLPEKEYKVRADYMGRQYFSEVFNWTDDIITIEEGVAEVSVSNMTEPLEGVNVYVFGVSGSYLGVHDITDSDGKVFFRLPAGEYGFRGDYMGNQYWSGTATLLPHIINPVNISTDGGTFMLTVLKDQDTPLAGVNCYLFNEIGSYLGEHETTNDQGEVGFNPADGIYKIRMDYLGYQFWTDVFDVPGTSSLSDIIAHQEVSVAVEGDYNGYLESKEGVNVYLFSPTDSYMGLHHVTNAQGQVIFDLPEKEYKVRADYMGRQYFSEVFNWTDDIITIEEGMAEVHMQQGSTPLEDVNVYVFTSAGTYLGIHAQTDSNGIVEFRLPSGTYKFRGDHQGNQYWATGQINAHVVNTLYLNTGGGTFTLIVEKEAGIHLINVPVYVFSSGGSYLGLTGHTDGSGQVAFDLSDGDYMFRADYLGYQFWSDVINVPASISDILTISHHDVTLTINEVYGYDVNVMDNILVYLFSSSGSYMGLYGITNEQGNVTFNLPQKEYRVRADCLSGQFWSDIFCWQDIDLDINHGVVDLHITLNAVDVSDAPVYLFSESGGYLGRYERTDENGHTEFFVPAISYKFRIDHEGTQHWSGVIHVIEHDVTAVDLILDQLALNRTNNPRPLRYDGVAPVAMPKEIKVAAIGSLAGILSNTVVASTPPPEVYYYMNDILGTPQLMIDEDGIVVWEAFYMPFGEADVNRHSTVVNNIRFPGQYFDAETGLHYNWHRYYDPRTGRYLTPDPSHSYQARGIGIGFTVPFLLNTPQEFNIYSYVRNNPINNIDMFGLQSSEIDFIPSPAYQKAVKNLQAHYLPKFQKISSVYNKCIKKCDQFSELECMEGFMLPVYISSCKIGCFVIYAKDFQLTSISCWVRLQLMYTMYQSPIKEQHYPGP